jgi:hypothetical protein
VARPADRPPKHDEFIELLRRAATAYHTPAYEETLQTHFHDRTAADIVQIVYPRR